MEFEQYDDETRKIRTTTAQFSNLRMYVVLWSLRTAREECKMFKVLKFYCGKLWYLNLTSSSSSASVSELRQIQACSAEVHHNSWLNGSALTLYTVPKSGKMFTTIYRLFSFDQRSLAQRSHNHHSIIDKKPGPRMIKVTFNIFSPRKRNYTLGACLMVWFAHKIIALFNFASNISAETRKNSYKSFLWLWFYLLLWYYIRPFNGSIIFQSLRLACIAL